MGHLELEKLLKALVVKTTRKHAPYTHSLTHLAEIKLYLDEDISHTVAEVLRSAGDMMF